MRGESSAVLVERLSTTIDRELARLLERGSEVAFVNYPNIGNVGDSAIWLGEMAALKRAGVRVAYQCDARTYHRRLLTSAVGERGTILIHGGANFGDVYPQQQQVRRRVLRDFPRARVVQLPQTIWFRSARKMARFAELCRAHDDFTVLVREALSLQLARDSGLRAVLCPDAAFALGPLARATSPSCDVLWLIRTDRERTVGDVPTSTGSEISDWPHGRDQKAGREGRDLQLAIALNRLLRAPIERGSRLSGLLWRPAVATFAPMSQRRLRAGLRLLSRGRVVITDRLHGHILATLAGIPNVALDSRSGKTRSTYETWTSACGDARFAETPEEAAHLASELIAGPHQVAAAGSR